MTKTFGGSSGKCFAISPSIGCRELDGAADLRRMNADQELQFRPAREIVDRLDNPIDEARKGVGRVVKLRVPDDIRQHADDRLLEIEPGIARESQRRPRSVSRGSRSSRARRASGSSDSARFSALPLAPSHVLPDGRRLVHQRVMIGVVVAEDEAVGAIGDEPVHDTHAELAADLADLTLRDVEAVMEDRDIEAVFSCSSRR